MALTECPECGNPLSDMASFCPHCGYSPELVEQAKEQYLYRGILGLSCGCWLVGLLLVLIAGIISALTSGP